MLHKSLRAAGIRFKNPCEFWSGLGRGSGGAPWRNEGPMMQGLHGKARAMACGGKPRALPDLRADAVPPTPKKRGRRCLTALEVLQAKSGFLEAGMFLGKICGSLAPAHRKGAAKCFLSYLRAGGRRGGGGPGRRAGWGGRVRVV